MKFDLSGRRFQKDFRGLDQQTRERVKKKLKDFSKNPDRPSFRVKPMRGYEGIWEAHISMGIVMTFEWDTNLPIEERTVTLRRIGDHGIYNQP